MPHPLSHIGRTRLTTNKHPSIRRKSYGIAPAAVPAEPPDGRRAGDVPHEDRLVAADAGEARVIVRDGDVEHFVAVRLVLLDQRVAAAAARRVEQADRSVGAAGQDLGSEADTVVSFLKVSSIVHVVRVLGARPRVFGVERTY